MFVRKWGPETQVNTSISGTQNEPSVAALSDGGYVIAWADDGGIASRIRFQRFDAEGRAVGAQGTIAGPVGQPSYAPAVAALPDGGFSIAFEREALGDADVIAVRFDAQGQAIGTDSHGLSNPGQNLDPEAVAVADGYLVVHELDGNIYASRNDAAGNSIFNSVRVNGQLGTASDADVAVRPDGTAVAVWHDTSADDIYAAYVGTNGGVGFSQLISRVGTAEGSNVFGSPSVAVLSNGCFVVTWVNSASALPGNGFDIRARIVHFESRTLLGSEFFVNSSTLGSQVSPEVVALRAGGFAAVWIDEAAGAIRGQVFDGFGARIGTEFLVSSSGESAATAVEDLSVAELADGRLIVTWTGTDENGTPGIVSQIVDPRGGIVTGTEAADRLLGHELVDDEITALNGNDELLGLRGDDALYAGRGDDALLGGRGDDLLFGSGGDDALAGGAGADELRGGWGVDRATYSGAVTVALDGSLAGTGEAAGDSFGGVEDLLGSAAADRLRGDAGGNAIAGGGAADSLEGQAGNDWLSGGAGADVLTGGLGNDRFHFAAPSEGGDTVTDFRAVAGNDDTFVFKGAAFAGLGAGPLADSRFQTRADNQAQDPDDRFVFRTTDRTLWFDADGKDGSAPVLLADLDAGATVTSADILIA